MAQMSSNVALPSSSHKPTASTAVSPGRRIALVDDDDLFRESLGMNLADEGFEIVPFAHGAPALDYFAQGGTADIILLDWRMPEIDGLEVLRRLRASSIDVPVIFLTALSDEIYEEAALAGGAVDFVEKSRSLSILLKRMHIIVDGRKTIADEADIAPVFRLGALELRLDTSRAYWDSMQIDLTLTEFNIVRLMATRAGTDVGYRDIYDLVHGKGFVAGYGPAGYRANVRAFIKRIRQKFRAVDPAFDRIENYPGFGYRWSDAPAGQSAGAGEED